jgi:hypothetical protein
MVANRTSEPCSKLYCRQQWLPEEVFLPGKEKLELQRKPLTGRGDAHG